MSWSYSGDPATSTMDAVRFYIGDTDTTDQQFQDEEIQYLLDQNSDNPLVASVVASRSLAAKYARRADKTVGDLSISYSQLSKNYLALADKLEDQASLFDAPAPYAGGISIADKTAVEGDADRVPPAFTVNLHINKRG